MSFFDIAFHVLSAALALYFSHVRFRARMPLFGHAMLASAALEVVFSLKEMDLPAYVCAAAFVWLYMKSLAILHEHGLHDGSFS
ncbi:MAG TPA: hypothetical protein VIT67_10945 [Povalibacter sp.]